MEWQPEVRQLYENMVLKMPVNVRPIIGPVLFNTAEKKCEDRKGKTIAERDLVVAIFEVTPPAIQPGMIEDIKSLGIDYLKYMVYVKSGFKNNVDLNQTVEDLNKIGDITGVKCNEEAIWKVLNAYKTFFSGSSISIRTTTKPKEERDVSIRYVELMVKHDPDPYITAINEGLLEKNGHPLHKMFYEIYDKFEIMGHGVDLDVRVGLTKLWNFITPCPVEGVYSMETFPKSILTLKDYFKKHGLSDFCLFALDFCHKTVNIYFIVKPGKVTREKCEAMLKDLNYKVGPPEVMERCRQATTIYYTFNWESDKIERVCFGVLCPEGQDQVPIHFHPLMKTFVEKAPFATDKRTFIYSLTFSPNENWFKVENDYTGTMIEILKMGAEGGLDL